MNICMMKSIFFFTNFSLLGLLLIGGRDFCSVGFALACCGWDFCTLDELLVGFTVVGFGGGTPLSLSLLFSGLKILFFFNFFCAGSDADFELFSAALADAVIVAAILIKKDPYIKTITFI